MSRSRSHVSPAANPAESMEAAPGAARSHRSLRVRVAAPLVALGLVAAAVASTGVVPQDSSWDRTTSDSSWDGAHPAGDPVTPLDSSWD